MEESVVKFLGVYQFIAVSCVAVLYACERKVEVHTSAGR
jgi:hypothetical protein